MWHKCDKWDQVDPYRMPKRYVFQFFMNRHFHFSKFIHIFHDFSTFAFAWTSSKNLNNLSVRPTSKQGKGLGVLVRTRIWTIPMKITAIRVIKLPPIMLNLQPSSIWKLIEICSAPFRIKLLFLTFMRSQMTANYRVRYYIQASTGARRPLRPRFHNTFSSAWDSWNYQDSRYSSQTMRTSTSYGALIIWSIFLVLQWKCHKVDEFSEILN